MRAMRWPLMLAFLACLAAAGCATSDKRSDDGPFGGFYGGANVGGAMP